MKRPLPHTKLHRNSISPAVLVCGDPQRATRIAEFLDNVSLIAEWREYRTLTGTFDGFPVTVCSHGIGAPGAAIAFEELIAAGARQIIRVGTCGGIMPAVDSGVLVIAEAAVQYTGYGRQIMPPNYPAVADLHLTLALEQAARTKKRPFHTGIVLTTDAFYKGIPAPHLPDYHQMAAAHVLAVEMECAALFLIGRLRQIRTAAILAADGNVLHRAEDMDTFDPHRDIVRQTIDDAIQIALQALKNHGPE